MAKPLMSSQHGKIIDAINDALSPLAEFTDGMSCEQYVTISAVLPIVNLLNTSVLKETTSDKALTNELRSVIITDLTRRNQEDDVLHLLEIACFLDSRFKDKFITGIEGVTEIIVSNVSWFRQIFFFFCLDFYFLFLPSPHLQP